VEVVQFPDRRAYREALALAFESQDAPDVFIRPHSLSQMIVDEWVQPLDPWITETWRDGFPPGSFAETRNIWLGKTYSFPVFAEGAQRMFFLNEDMFRQAGLVDDNGEILKPDTWEELRTMAAEITRAGEGDFYGIGIGIKDPRDMSRWFDMASLAGAPMTPYDYHFRTGEFIYGLHPGYAQIIELLLGMKEDGSVYPYESTLEDGNIYTYFAQDKFAMFMSGSYVVSNLSADFPEFQDYRIVPLPIPEGGQSGEYNLLPGTGVYYMSADTKHPDEAWLWLDWLSTRDHHKRMVAQTSNFSVYADLNTAENIQDEHTLQAYEALTAYGVYGPFPPGRNPQTALVSPEPVTPDVGDLLVGIYTGQIKDWQSALDDLDMRKQMAFEDALLTAQDNGVNVSWEDFIFIDWNPMEDYLNYPTE
jgi:ABC-type glycerol-3-phosphate transport system substrate-binding protein